VKINIYILFKYKYLVVKYWAAVFKYLTFQKLTIVTEEHKRKF